MFFISHLHKKLGQVELINTDTFQGSCCDFRNHIEDSLVVFTGDGNFEAIPTIRSSDDAMDKLFNRFPVLLRMSFKNYRLVGGACTSFIKSSGYAEDLDFFPLVERYPNESEAIREGRVQQVYVDFLHEIEQVYHAHLADRYNFLLYRNEDCTTILMTLKIAPYNAHRTKQKNLKLQFVHRAFDSESQMLLCSDLMASQILFDGIGFKCTYACMMALKSNLLPVDFSSASTSMAYRVHKYGTKKSFIVVLCGLESAKIKNVLQSKTEVQKTHKERRATLTRHQKSIRTRDEIRQIWLDSKLLLPCGLIVDPPTVAGRSHFFSLGMDFQHKESDTLGLAVTEADYSDYGGISDLERGGELAEINVNAFIDGKQLHVYAKDVASFLKTPTPEVHNRNAEIRLAFSQLSHIRKDLSMTDIGRLFGSHAKEALLAYFDKDEVAYHKVVERRISELRTGMVPLFENLQRVKWRMVDPGAQAIGSMRPVKISAREGYGELYDPMICTYAWDVKMIIIGALRRKHEEKECLLVQYLGRDMLKYIFFHLDLLYAAEQCAVYFSLLCTDDHEKLDSDEIIYLQQRQHYDDRETSEERQEYLEYAWEAAAGNFDDLQYSEGYSDD